ncbi:MAG TPA: dihydrodipicolinate synthase family protein [Planctomycetaceae bacterium]|nr:dihydrodipicolinate synthase family protein [Planctomycetaceae bacterium]
MNIDQVPAIKPRRKILGMSAILLPLLHEGTQVDWPSFEAHVTRTLDAGLIPAVNMDTGYANLIDEETRVEVLQRTQTLCGGREYVAGAYVGDMPGDAFNHDGYASQIEKIKQHSGTPVFFQSYGLVGQTDDALIEAYGRLGELAERFVAFELGDVFAPFGKIYSLDVYRQLLGIPQCMGAKHSSLRRDLEWQRLELRDQLRPDFHVLTGNDLAIDMVIYGSDYLLGLSTMAPDLFGKRDQMWLAGDPLFYQLNDVLQYMGFFAFRAPVPAYKHTAAQFLAARGWLTSSRTYPGSPERPNTDQAILETLLEQLEQFA